MNSPQEQSSCAGEVVELLQFSEDRPVDWGTESVLEFVEGGNLGLEQVLTQDIRVEQRAVSRFLLSVHNKTSRLASTASR